MNMEDIINSTGNTAETTAEATADTQTNVQYLMQKIDQILADTQYFKDAIAQFGAEGNSADAGLVAMVEAREKTNQEIIALLNKMLDFVLEPPVISSKEKMKIIFDFMTTKNLDDDDNAADIVRQVIQKITCL